MPDTRYLVTVQLDSASNIRRVQDDAPGIVAIIKGASSVSSEPCFRSSDGLLFGLFIKSSLEPAIIRSKLDASQHTTNKDAFIVVEIGAKSDGVGLTRALTWLRRY